MLHLLVVCTCIRCLRSCALCRDNCQVMLLSVIYWFSLIATVWDYWTVTQNGYCNLKCYCSILFFSRPRSEGWPHYGRTFSIYFCPLSFWLTLPWIVQSTYWCCPSRPCVVFLACVHLALFLALSLSPGKSFLVSSWCDHSMLASLLIAIWCMSRLHIGSCHMKCIFTGVPLFLTVEKGICT